jgi:hypothetical protein
MNTFPVPLYDPISDLVYTLNVTEQTPGVLVGTVRATIYAGDQPDAPVEPHPVIVSVHLGTVQTMEPDAIYAPLQRLLSSLARALRHELAGGEASVGTH